MSGGKMKATIVIENPPTKATRNAKSGTVRVMTREMTTNANRMETFRGPHSFPQHLSISGNSPSFIAEKYL